MIKLKAELKILLPIILSIFVVGIYLIYNHTTEMADNKGRILYAECYEKYQEKYDELTNGINQKNAQEKAPTLYNDENKEIIKEMGIILDEYDEKLASYTDSYIVFFDLRESYDKLKIDFNKLEKWNDLSYTEQLEVRVSFLLMY